MIAWPVLSYNGCNTSHLMGIVRTKRVYLRIPSVGDHTYTTLLETAQSVVNSSKLNTADCGMVATGPYGNTLPFITVLGLIEAP